MKTFWCRVTIDRDVKMPWLDTWTTGETAREQEVRCFALRAMRRSQVEDLLVERLPVGSYQVDFVEPRPWKVFGDFAGPKSRFPIEQQYLNDEIDNVAAVRGRK